MRVDGLGSVKQFGKNGDLAPALGAAPQVPDPDRGGLEEAPAPTSVQLQSRNPR